MWSGAERLHGVLRRLLRDRAGNTIAIVAASTIPLLALAGGGVDVSRAYMAKTQLQAACDAGVLAGRRAMSKSGTYGDSERAKADTMFDFNFDGETINALDVDFTTQDNAEGQVYGTATATMPTAVMKIFGKDTVDLSVGCMAELQLANVDVMFVLDTTGSMGGSRIVALRDAVEDFHKTIDSAVNDEQVRVRYGFVPYSMAVNVSGLISSGAMPTSYIADTTAYQSREADFRTPVYVAEVGDAEVEYETYGDKIQWRDCRDYGDNEFPYNGRNPDTSGSAPGTVTSIAYSVESWTDREWRGSGRRKREYGTCTRRVTTTETTYTERYGFTRWIYQQTGVDTSSYRTGSSVAAATYVNDATVDVADSYDVVELAAMNGSAAQNVSTTNYTWGGCIEERQTVDEDEDGFDPIPDGALDLDINSAPVVGDNDTKWKPFWGSIIFDRGNNYTSWATMQYRSNEVERCPRTMMLFREVDTSGDGTTVPGWLEDYLDDLNPSGNTYHDIGMIWGARLASPNGIFAANVNEGGDIQVSRHILFMTDGEMNPISTGYSSYGVEKYDQRIAFQDASWSELRDRHTARFEAACEAIKAEGYTVWVVGFGSSLTNAMENCSSGGRAYFASDDDELQATFRFIASQIADLRLGE